MPLLETVRAFLILGTISGTNTEKKIVRVLNGDKKIIQKTISSENQVAILILLEVSPNS